MRFSPFTSAAESLSRERLINCALHAEPRAANSTLILAPAGFGKTTLLVQIWSLLQRQGCRVAWLNCSSEDDQPDVFVANLGACLQNAELFDTTSEFGVGDIATALAGKGPVAVFLDEYENANSDATDNVLETFIRLLPKDCKAFIATRELPRISLSKLLVDTRTRMVDARALQFTREEACSLMSNLPGSEDLAAVIDRSEGWPVMLQLARLDVLNLGDQPLGVLSDFDRRTRVFNYIAEQVLDKLESNQRRFLLEVSILSEVDVASASAISQRPDSERLLTSLLRLRPIVTVIGDEPLTIRLHSLFRDFLQHEAASSLAEMLPVLHQRAALHHAHRGNLSRAVQHATAAGSNELIARILEDAGGALLTVSEGVGRVRSFLAALPPTLVSSRRRLRLMRIMLQVMDGTSADWFVDFDRLLHTLELSSPESTPGSDGCKLEVDLIQFIREMSESAHAFCEAPWERIHSIRQQTLAKKFEDPRYHGIELTVETNLLTDYGSLQRAETRVEELRNLFVSENFAINLSWASTHIATIALARGDLATSDSHARAVLERISESGETKNTMMRQHCNAVLGQAFHEQNQPDIAIAHFDTIPGCSPYTVLSTIVFSTCTKARCLFMLGKQMQAIAELEEAYRFAVEEALPHFSIIAAAVGAELRLVSGDPAGAVDLIHRASLERALDRSKAWFTRPWLESEALARLFSLLWIHQKNYERAYDLSHEFATREAESGRHVMAARSELVATEAALGLGRSNQARAALSRAVDHLAGTAVVRPFLDAGADVSALFSAMAEQGAFGARERVAAILDARNGGPEVALDSLGRLSPREHDVMIRLGRGCPPKIIARELNISYETVRHHLKNIYGKLRANSRSEAVSEARSRHLIP